MDMMPAVCYTDSTLRLQLIVSIGFVSHNLIIGREARIALRKIEVGHIAFCVCASIGHII